MVIEWNSVPVWQVPEPAEAREVRTVEVWIAAVKDELGIDLEVDVAELRDMTAVVAHETARRAVPLTSFLVGYAAARAGGGPVAVTEASRRAAALAESWVGVRQERSESV
jgi:hypothetical protein